MSIPGAEPRSWAYLRSMPRRPLLVLGFTLLGAAVALAAVSMSARRTYRALDAAAVKRQTAYEFLMALRQLRQHVGEVRVGVTGFVMTRDSLYRATYAGGMGGLARDTAALRALAGGQRTLDEPLDRLGPAVAAYARAMTTVMEGATREPSSAPAPQLAQLRDAFLLEGVRTIFVELEQAQGRLMQAGASEVTAAVRRSSGIITTVLIVGVFLVIGAGGAVFAQLLARDMERRTREYAAGLADRSRQLEAANRDLDSFSHSVAHDLRAPLRAVDGYAHVLREDYGPQLDADGAHVIDLIHENVRKMRKLIDDLLAFSKMGRQRIDAVKLDMDQLVRSAIAETTSHEHARTIDVRVGAVPPAFGDTALVKQVWLNLLNNAVKYTRPRERAEIDVAGAIQHGEVVYSVKDNGVGFEMRESKKLFGVFQRLHGADEFEGTGVGLALVQRIVQRHGGRVWAEGKTDEGAVFSFTLPGAKRDSLPA